MQVLIISFSLAVLNCELIAVFGYLMYEDDTKSQVTLNFPAGKFYSRNAIYTTTLVNPFLKYAWALTPIAMPIEGHLSSNFDGERKPNIIIRTLLVIGTVIIALAITFFAYIMAFLGSFLGITVSVLLPCVCYLKIFSIHRKCGIELVNIIFILVFRTIAAILGTYSSVRRIISSL